MRYANLYNIEVSGTRFIPTESSQEDRPSVIVIHTEIVTKIMRNKKVLPIRAALSY